MTSSDAARLVALFDDTRDARSASAALIESGFPKGAVAVVQDRSAAEKTELQADMAEEVDDLVAGPGLVIPQGADGASAIGPVLTALFSGLLLGALVGAVWAFAFDADISWFVRLIIPIVSFGAAGSVVGFVAGASMYTGALEGDRPGENPSESPGATYVEVRDNESDHLKMAASVLRRFGPKRIDLADAGGNPLPSRDATPPWLKE